MNGGLGALYACPKAGCAPVAATPIVSGRQPGGLAASDAGAFVSFIYGTAQIDRVEASTATRIGELDGITAALRLAMRDATLFIDAYYVPSDAGAHPRTIVRWDGPDTRTTIGTFASSADAPVNTEQWHVTSERRAAARGRRGRGPRGQLRDRGGVCGAARGARAGTAGLGDPAVRAPRGRSAVRRDAASPTTDVPCSTRGGPGWAPGRSGAS